jgi:hypothetical protein
MGELDAQYSARVHSFQFEHPKIISVMDINRHSIEQFFGFSISKINISLPKIVHIYNYFTKNDSFTPGNVNTANPPS